MTILILAILVSLAWGTVDWYRSTLVSRTVLLPDRPPVPVQCPAAPIPATIAPVPVPPPAPELPPEVTPDPPTPADPPDSSPPAIDLSEEGDDDCDDDKPYYGDPTDDDCDGEEPDDENTDPAPPESSAPIVVRIAGLLTDGSRAVYDTDRCWGCERGCTYRKMRVPGCSTADAIRARAETRYRAQRGYASDRDAADGDLGDWRDLAGTPSGFNPIAVARAVGESKRNAWFELCESCSAYVRTERREGRNPWRIEPVATVAAEECPF